MRSRGIVVLCTLLALVLAMVAFAGSVGAGNDISDQNKVSYWCDEGVKLEPVSTPFKVPEPPEGYTWTLLVLKAGTENSTALAPVAGQSYVHPNGKQISHVILCKQSNPPVTVATTTEPPTTTTTEPPTTTTTEPTSTTTTPTSSTTTLPATTTTTVPVTTTSSSTTTLPPTTTVTSSTSTTTVPPTTTTTIDECQGERNEEGECELPFTGMTTGAVTILGLVFALSGLTILAGVRWWDGRSSASSSIG